MDEARLAFSNVMVVAWVWLGPITALLSEALGGSFYSRVLCTLTLALQGNHSYISSTGIHFKEIPGLSNSLY